MIKALFLDFYGTVVEEDDSLTNQIAETICNSADTDCTVAEVLSYWKDVMHTLHTTANGASFQLQREIEHATIYVVTNRFRSSASPKELSDYLFEYWERPKIFDDSKAFFEACAYPIYIVTNSDRKDLSAALTYHQLEPHGVITSEDACAYKPSHEIFNYALSAFRRTPNEVLFLGDSLSNDVYGAKQVGMSSIWVNRNSSPVPQDIIATPNLLQSLNLLEQLG